MLIVYAQKTYQTALSVFVLELVWVMKKLQLHGFLIHQMVILKVVYYRSCTLLQSIATLVFTKFVLM